MTTTQSDAGMLEHNIGGQGELVLRLHTGEIEIRGTSDGTVRVRNLDGRGVEEEFEVERGPGRFALRPRDRFLLDIGVVRRGRGSGRLAVEVPSTAKVSIDTASADVRASGLRGDQRYRTASGGLRLRDAGGPIAIDAVSGSVSIEAAAAIELSGRTVSGDLDLTGGSLRSLAFGSTSGDLQLRSPLEGTGPFSIQTVSGDVDVVTGEQGLRIEARTITGQITSDVPAQSEGGTGRRRMTVGAGRAELVFKSISGDLRVATYAPRSGAASSHVAPEPPAPPAPPTAPLPPTPPATPAEPGLPADLEADPRLAVLRDLEAGRIDVDTATRRLAEIEERSDV